MKFTAMGILLLMAVLLAFRNRSSFCQSDESFYAALLHRFWLGERPVADEWHRAQFYAPMLLPFYALFMKLNGSTDGVMLFLRELYLCFSLVVSLKLFDRFYRETESALCAFLSATVILLFCRANIAGVSYYNLCMLCGVSGFCSLSEARNGTGENTAGKTVWAGILFAAAVLCDPFLSVFYIVLIGIGCFLPGERKTAGYLLIGNLIVAAGFVAFLLQRTGAGELLRNFPMILNNTEQSDSVWLCLKDSVFEAARFSRFVAIPALIMLLLLAFNIGKRQRGTILVIYLLIQACLLGYTGYRLVRRLCDGSVIPFCVVCFPFLFDALRSGRSRAAAELFLLGLVHAAAYSLASNTGVDAATTGYCMSAAAGFCLIGETARTDASGSRGARRAVAVFLGCALLVPMSVQRIVGVYRDAPLSMLDTQLTSGPAKGLITTAEHAEQYEEIVSGLARFDGENPEGRILFVKNLPWAYLCTDRHYGVDAPWRVYTDQLEEYYRMHPENRADDICCFDETVGAWQRSGFNPNPEKETPNEFDYSGEFWAHVLASEVVFENRWMTVYHVEWE